MTDIYGAADKKNSIKLTQYSHGAGCGCKISPQVLDKILHSNLALPDNKKLIVGNHTKDDAAVYDLGNGSACRMTGMQNIGSQRRKHEDSHAVKLRAKIR